MKKIIILNILLFFAILATSVLTLAISIDFYKFITSKSSLKKIDKRVNLPIYKDLEWPSVHFEEEKLLKSSYYDYIGWKRDDFKGQTINIVNGYRLNKIEEDFNFKKDVWVFGGSTIWGSGVRDHETIPAYLEQITNISTLNLGEFGYTSSQELNLYIKNIILHKPKVVLFYDGFNDVFHKCRSENNYYSGARESFFKQKIMGEKYVQSYTINFFEPIKRIVAKFNLSVEKNSYFDCDKNQNKSKKIAQVLVNNWKIANSISKENNIKFVPILQPVAYFTDSLVDHINLNEQIKLQFETVYPLIIEEINKNNLSYINLMDSLSDKKTFFIDHVHLAPIGNKQIASDILRHDLMKN